MRQTAIGSLDCCRPCPLRKQSPFCRHLRPRRPHRSRVRMTGRNAATWTMDSVMMAGQVLSGVTAVVGQVCTPSRTTQPHSHNHSSLLPCADCSDCGPRVCPSPPPLPPALPSTCEDDALQCEYLSDGLCDDGGPGAEYTACSCGTGVHAYPSSPTHVATAAHTRSQPRTHPPEGLPSAASLHRLLGLRSPGLPLAPAPARGVVMHV